MSFTAEDETVFVTGCENGTVVKCSLDSPASLEVRGMLNSKKSGMLSSPQL